MERLTKRIDGGIERVCHHYPEEEKRCYGCVKRTACNAALFDRLAYYEDMEEQGRLILLPCRVGDVVYMENGDDETPHFVDTGKVFAIGVDENGTMWISVRYESGLKFYHPSTDVGKTVFLTREEAEQVLKGGADK